MKDVFFPHGDIQYKSIDSDGNLWREMSFALFLLRQAVNPMLSFRDCIENWSDISKDLAEPPRKRKTQIKNMLLLS